MYQHYFEAVFVVTRTLDAYREAAGAGARRGSPPTTKITMTTLRSPGLAGGAVLAVT